MRVVLVEAGGCDLGVDLGGLEVGVAEDELEAFHRHDLGQGKSGESVTGGVEGEIVRDST